VANFYGVVKGDLDNVNKRIISIISSNIVQIVSA